MTECLVFRCARQADMYLYVRADQALGELPAALLERVGQLTQVMNLQLTAGRRLARADVTTVIEHLNTQGFYLQMPPNGQITARLYQGD